MEVAEGEGGRGGNDLACGRSVRPERGSENGAWRGSEWVRRSERRGARGHGRDGIKHGSRGRSVSVESFRVRVHTDART